MHLGKLFEIDHTVMILQYQLEGIGLDFPFFCPIAELMLDGVVQVHHQQFVLVLILNAHEQIIGLCYVSLANGD